MIAEQKQKIAEEAKAAFKAVAERLVQFGIPLEFRYEDGIEGAGIVDLNDASDKLHSLAGTLVNLFASSVKGDNSFGVSLEDAEERLDIARCLFREVIQDLGLIH
jgi:hypothetical protein